MKMEMVDVDGCIWWNWFDECNWIWWVDDWCDSERRMDMNIWSELKNEKKKWLKMVGMGVYEMKLIEESNVNEVSGDEWSRKRMIDMNRWSRLKNEKKKWWMIVVMRWCIMKVKEWNDW